MQRHFCRFPGGPSGKRPIIRTGFRILPFQGHSRAAFYSNIVDSVLKSATSSEGQGFLALPSGNVPDFCAKSLKSVRRTPQNTIQNANLAISVRDKVDSSEGLCCSIQNLRHLSPRHKIQFPFLINERIPNFYLMPIYIYPQKNIALSL